MKKIILSFTLLLITVSQASAQMGMMGQQLTATDSHAELSVDELTSQLLADQNVASITDLDCSQIPDDQLEILGDSVMSLMHPDSQVHEAMDNMMGGEESESLKAAHIRMAQNYLGCSGDSFTMMGSTSDSWPTKGTGMTSGRGLDSWGSTFKNMHRFEGGNALWNLHLILMTITWASITALLIALTRYYWKKVK